MTSMCVLVEANSSEVLQVINKAINKILGIRKEYDVVNKPINQLTVAHKDCYVVNKLIRIIPHLL